MRDRIVRVPIPEQPTGPGDTTGTADGVDAADSVAPIEPELTAAEPPVAVALTANSGGLVSAPEDPSPLQALHDRSTRHVRLPAPVPVQVYVNINDHDDWYSGELVEWAYYETLGWTGWVRYALAPAERFNGRFVADRIRATSNTTGPTGSG